MCGSYDEVKQVGLQQRLFDMQKPATGCLTPRLSV